jgi:hypothetical protein
MKKIWLSPSALGLFNDCPHCFWLDRTAKKPRPRGIFPSLPGGMDLALKRHYDAYRAKRELPPEIRGQLPPGCSLFQDVGKLDLWRNWRTGLKAETNVAVIGGALDDLMVTPEFFSPFDYKTKGSLPKDGDSEKYYGHQLDVYAFMLACNGMKPSGLAHLAYYSVRDVQAYDVPAPIAPVDFDCTVVHLKTSVERAADIINRAAECLGGAMPAPACEYCAFAQVRAGLMVPAEEPA